MNRPGGVVSAGMEIGEHGGNRSRSRDLWPWASLQVADGDEMRNASILSLLPLLRNDDGRQK